MGHAQCFLHTLLVINDTHRSSIPRPFRFQLRRRFILLVINEKIWRRAARTKVAMVERPQI